MTDLADTPVRASTTDLIDALAGITSGSPLDLLRRHRPVTRLEAQASQDVIFAAADGSGVTTIDRHALALRVAAHHGAASLVASHREALAGLGASDTAPSPKWAAMRDFADLLALRPGDATAADLGPMKEAGLGVDDIVVVAQLVGFVSYQARLLAGIALIGAAAEGTPA